MPGKIPKKTVNKKWLLLKIKTKNNRQKYEVVVKETLVSKIKTINHDKENLIQILKQKSFFPVRHYVLIRFKFFLYQKPSVLKAALKKELILNKGSIAIAA